METKDTNNFGSATEAGRGDIYMKFETRTNTTREKNCHKRKKEKMTVVAVVEENRFLTKELVQQNLQRNKNSKPCNLSMFNPEYVSANYQSKSNRCVDLVLTHMIPLLSRILLAYFENTQLHQFRVV